MPTKTEYRKYIQSEAWQQRRKKFLRTNEECNRCELPRYLAIIAYDQDLHVHHRSYQNVGSEPSQDLEALCKRCHDIETFGRSEMREIKRYSCGLCELKHFNPYSDLCRECEMLCWGFAVNPEVLLKDNPMNRGRRVFESVVATLVSEVGASDLLEYMADFEKKWNAWRGKSA